MRWRFTGNKEYWSKIYQLFVFFNAIHVHESCLGHQIDSQEPVEVDRQDRLHAPSNINPHPCQTDFGQKTNTWRIFTCQLSLHMDLRQSSQQVFDASNYTLQYLDSRNCPTHASRFAKVSAESKNPMGRIYQRFPTSG